MSNIILNSDSYKYSMHVQYPPNTTRVFSYIESRGGEFNETVFFGLQAFIKQHLTKPITMADVEEARELITAHGEPFNYEGWRYIVEQHNGKLPVSINAAPEGTVLEVGNVLVTIENTDPNCFWLTTFLETALLRAVWYPTTVATVSYRIKRIIGDYLRRTGDPGLIDFKLHDFGARGVSSEESAGIGGAAHLVNFRGTDTVSALVFAKKYYNESVAGFSIPAMEHSTVTSWGREGESAAYENMIKHYSGANKIFAAVSDSYDIYNAVDNIWGDELKNRVLEMGGTVVIRPDSGDPATVVLNVVKKLWDRFGGTTNEKGYRVLNPAVRVIQGDGINEHSILKILIYLEGHKFSADNVAFGMGGALLQQINRDTLKFAMKCSAVEVDGEWRDVYKDPVTDKGKTSKRGRLGLYKNSRGYFTQRESQYLENQLREVYRDGVLLVDDSFSTIRHRASVSY
jgi:nicotinamide phosphoribosyltransferase